MTWFTAASVSINNGQNIVSINTTADDIFIVQEESMIFINGIGPGWVKRGYLDGSGNKKLELYTPWEFGNQVNQPAKVIWTDGGLAKYARILQEVGEDSVTFAQAMAQILSSVDPLLNIETKTSGTVAVKPYGYLVQQVENLLATMGDFGVPLYDTDTKNQALTLLGLPPQLTAQPTQDLDFENNDLKVYSQYGLTKKLITEALTPVRASTATYMSPFGIDVAAVNEPRIEYDQATQKCLGLLIEESRTNALLNSNNMLASPWAHVAPAVVTEDSVTPPIVKGGTCFNVAGADNVGFSGSNLRTVITITPNLLYQFSIWVYPSAACDKISLRSNSDTLGQSSSTFIFDVIPNKWQRISMPCARSTVSLTVTISAANATNVGAPFKVSAAQCEAGETVTSLIPTMESQVTRLADAVTAPWFASLEGTVCFTVSGLSNSARRGIIGILSNDLITRIGLTKRFIGSNAYRLIWRGDGGTLEGPTFEISPGKNKIAFTFSKTEMRCYLNGAFVSSLDTSSTAINTKPQIIDFMGSVQAGGTDPSYKAIFERIKTYPKVLSDIELEELTRV